MIAKLINPKKITDFNRTKADLELFAIFAVCVAGKGSQQTADKVNHYFREIETPTKQLTPFEGIRAMKDLKLLSAWLQMTKLGQYTRIYNALLGLIKLDLKTCSVKDLESVHGIGPKTARFIIMHSRPNQRLATLDTHILRWMRDQGIDTPKATPQSQKLYKELEDKFLTLCDESAILPSQLDLKIWKQYSK